MYLIAFNTTASSTVSTSMWLIHNDFLVKELKQYGTGTDYYMFAIVMSLHRLQHSVV